MKRKKRKRNIARVLKRDRPWKCIIEIGKTMSIWRQESALADSQWLSDYLAKIAAARRADEA
jgi:hypothetical protein